MKFFVAFGFASFYALLIIVVIIAMFYYVFFYKEKKVNNKCETCKLPISNDDRHRVVMFVYGVKRAWHGQCFKPKPVPQPKRRE